MDQTTKPQVDEKKWARLVAQVWADEQLRKRMLADPIPVLREHGIEVPEGADVRVIEPTPNRVYFVLPPKPANVTELTPEALAAVAGGSDFTITKSTDVASSNLYTGSSSSTTSSSCWSCAVF